MACQQKNNKNFLVIKMPWTQYVALTDSFGMCDCCDYYDANADFYYVAVENIFLCKTCYEAWLSGATHYSVDMEKERNNWNEKTKVLKAMGIWDAKGDR